MSKYFHLHCFFLLPVALCFWLGGQSWQTPRLAHPQSHREEEAALGQSSSAPPCRERTKQPTKQEGYELLDLFLTKLSWRSNNKSVVCTLRCGDVSKCSSSFSSALIGPLCSSSATYQSVRVDQIKAFNKRSNSWL